MGLFMLFYVHNAHRICGNLYKSSNKNNSIINFAFIVVNHINNRYVGINNKLHQEHPYFVYRPTHTAH